MKILRNIICMFIITIILGLSSNVYGMALKVPQNPLQTDALNRVEKLGIMDKLSKSTDETNKIIGRDQFSKIIVISSGNQDLAESLMDQSIFPDVKTNNKMVGYVNAAVEKGFLTGTADRKFHPEQNVTFAQVCTALVKALGYGDNDVSGIWPKNYIDKARSLKLLDSINLKNNDGVSRLAMASMIDRMLNTNIKKVSAQDTDKTLAISAGIYEDYIILGNSETIDRLDENQILTDKGILYTTESAIKLEVGNKYRLLTNDDTIQNVYYSLKSLKNISINDVKDSKITYTENDKQISMTLPDKVVYYYNGVKQSYDSIISVLQGDNSIIFAKNDNNIGYEYAVVIANTTGLYGDYIILGNSKTDDKLVDNQVLTDKGILYLVDSSVKLEVGNKYRFLVDGDRIKKIENGTNLLKTIVVDSVNDINIAYKDNGKVVNMILPDKVVYYYKGVKQTYDNLKNLLQGNSTIIFAYNDDKIAYDYAIILDPVYSKPEIAMNIKVGDTKIGSIDLSDWSSVIKNGEFINPYDILNGDVVYQVTDVGNTNKYILALDDKVEGKITGILPNRISPKTIQIDNKSYDISNDMDISKLNNKGSLFKVDDVVQISLGYDGKIVKMDYPLGQDNANFAYVINSSTTLSNGNPIYNVKLLMADGTVCTYKTYLDSTNLKGLLVNVRNVGSETVELLAIMNTNYSEMNINLGDMKIGDNYVTDNVRIFDVISNVPGQDANVKILNWNDLYSGILPAGKVLYMNQVGIFGDINVILLNDALDEGYSYGLVKSATASGKGRSMTYNYTLGVNGKDYQWSTTSAFGISETNVIGVNISSGQVSSYSGIVNMEPEATIIQGIDTKKIKLNNTIYKFRNDVTVYYKDSDGNITEKPIGDIDITKTYLRVGVYLDKPLSYGGKVKMIVISE